MPEAAALSFDFVEKLPALDSPEAVISAFGDAAGRFGYSTFALGALPAPGSPALQSFFVSTWPGYWVDTYVAEGLAINDPNIGYAYEHILPATFSELRERQFGGREGVRTLEIATAHGWPEGLTIPVHGPRGYRGLITVAGETKDLPLRQRAALHMMALYMHERLKELMAPHLATPIAEQPRLTRGEIECIRWLLAGKSDWEIGEILGIAEATAHWRIERAKKKLGVKTRAQLTALAVYHGLVQP
jgi:LuxR family transcriptional regulator, quorum-sensing system regulator BjaR1